MREHTKSARHAVLFELLRQQNLAESASERLCRSRPAAESAEIGLVQSLAEYQLLAGAAAWDGTRRDAIQALLANPLCRDLRKTPAVYDALAAAHRQYLPERLLRD